MNPDEILALYGTGSYGTPDKPIRSNSVKAAFWRGYFDHPAPARNTVTYSAYRAGRIARSHAQLCDTYNL